MNEYEISDFVVDTLDSTSLVILKIAIVLIALKVIYKASCFLIKIIK